MHERRQCFRIELEEELCVIFNTGTFGQIKNISETGLSVALFGISEFKEETDLEIFRLSGPAVSDSIQCEFVRRVPKQHNSNGKKIRTDSENACFRFVLPDTQKKHIKKIMKELS